MRMLQMLVLPLLVSSLITGMKRFEFLSQKYSLQLDCDSVTYVTKIQHHTDEAHTPQYDSEASFSENLPKDASCV